MIDRGPWIQTFTGRRFHYADPQPDDIHIFDIAHGLSMLCRYAGQCTRFYSVAEHSVQVSHQFADPKLAMIGLLHDATEAYCSDLPRPLKQMLPAYQEYENKLWSVIARKFGLPADLPAEVHEVDTRMLVTERPHLFHRAVPWPGFEGIEYLPDVNILCLEPYRAKQEFLDQFNRIKALL